MRALASVKPTPEQLAIIANPGPGVQVIRGSAGSGKTTTALLMVRLLSNFYLRRRERLAATDPVNVLVLTFNRTLRGYVADLARQEIESASGSEISVAIYTFARWTTSFLPHDGLLGEGERKYRIQMLSASLPIANDVVLDEVDYVLGRFKPSDLEAYLSCRRIGRGTSPRIGDDLRRRLIDEVVQPYARWKQESNRIDWNDMAVRASSVRDHQGYDIIIADEVQDFSANEIRAVMNHAKAPSTVVFVMDAAQRIYPRAFTWGEAGVTVARSDRLKVNYRNTREICKFALPLLEGLDIGDDGTFPDFKSCKRTGPVPTVVVAKYSQQLEYVFARIESQIDLSSESVAFLKPAGGGWFDYLKASLHRMKLDFVEITRESEWPGGEENIALSTMFSAKGLEFDHVFIMGLNEEVTPHGSSEDDTALDNYRRLLAMAITRARKSVIVGYKPGEASKLVTFLKGGTYDEVNL